MPVDIEVVRNFWNKRPCNVRHSAKKLASSEYFSEITNRRYKVEPHIKEFADFTIAQGGSLAKNGQDLLFNLVEHYPKPVIAAVNGFALGGG